MNGHKCSEGPSVSWAARKEATLVAEHSASLCAGSETLHSESCPLSQALMAASGLYPRSQSPGLTGTAPVNLTSLATLADAWARDALIGCPYQLCHSGWTVLLSAMPPGNILKGSRKH